MLLPVSFSPTPAHLFFTASAPIIILAVPFCAFPSLAGQFLLQTCLVTFAYMAAQWPSYLAQFPGTSSCSQQSWPQGPNSLWLWLCQWNNCRRFNDSYLILWGSRQVHCVHEILLILQCCSGLALLYGKPNMTCRSELHLPD